MKITLLLTLALTPVSRGALILWEAQDIPIPSTFPGVYLDLATGDTHNSDAVGFTTAQVNFFFGGLGIGSDEDFLPARVGTGASDPVQPANFGELVDGTLTFGPEGHGASENHVSNTPGPNQFASGVPGYLAFQLDLNEDGSFVFGWMKVTLTNGSSEGTIHEWAYSDVPGEPVVVGVVPEPSSGLLLVMGLTASLAFRRRSD